jgi:hypothetical protein
MNRRAFLGMLAAASLPGRKSAFTAEGGKKIKPVGAQLSTVSKQMKDDFDGADNSIDRKALSGTLGTSGYPALLCGASRPNSLPSTA